MVNKHLLALDGDSKEEEVSEDRESGIHHCVLQRILCACVVSSGARAHIIGILIFTLNFNFLNSAADETKGKILN